MSNSETRQPLKERIRLSESRRQEALALLSKGKSNKEISSPDFAEQLFQRAPDKFLLGQSASSLAETARQTLDFYLEYLASGSTSLVKVFNPEKEEREGVTVLLSAISDRPFVVDTVSEYLGVMGINTSVFLHPIFESSGKTLTSVIYVELEKIEDQAQHREIENKLKSILADLVVVTDDFRKIREKGKDLSTQMAGAAGKGSKELSQLLNWVAEGGFVFLGYQMSETTSNGSKPSASEALGLFRSLNSEIKDSLQKYAHEAHSLLGSGKDLVFSKIPLISEVHRRAFIESVDVKIPGTEEVHSLVGLLTSRAIAQEASSVPLIESKLAQTLQEEKVLKYSHDYKEIVSLVDSMPKSELFQSTTQDLRSLIAVTLDVHQHASTRVVLQHDETERFAYIVVVLTRSRFTMGARSRIQKVIAEELSVPFDLIEHRLAISVDPLVRIHYAIPLSEKGLKEIDLEDLENKVAMMSLTWDDRLRIQQREENSLKLGPELTGFYQRNIPADFKAGRGAAETLEDIKHLETLSADNPIEASLEAVVGKKDNNEEILDLRIYKAGEEIALSDVVPLLEFAGFKVISEKVSTVPSTFSNDSKIYSLTLSSQRSSREEIISNRDQFISGIKAIFKNESGSDQLNELLVNPGLSVAEISILRTLQHYLWQLKIFASERVIGRALVKHPQLAAILVEYFNCKFNPERPFKNNKERVKKLGELKDEFFEALKSVPRLTHDRALRALLNVVDSIVRTNAFNSKYPGAVAIKIDCSRIEKMPAPRPVYETFINSPRVEGVHLRGGMVSRGGLRWSERSEDYRTEILGLMKTQRVKNAIIIPLGAKGGFVVKEKTSDRAYMRDLVETGYREFITNLLELSDNRVEGKIKPPTDLIIYDGEDPYLVVAADKGTATFSDLANSIATDDFGFWLDDAFASGGSNGYDHKKLGITAKGAWEAVIHHFRARGIDPAGEEFSCVGVGDLSGDVFGNGMLRSDKMLLKAAFNHKHIFIDPTPDASKSFAERQRMFELPRSDWTDYNQSLISAGGGIFDRSSKEIEISKEAQKALGVKEKVLSGDSLVQAILKAPVDLLWNGGIGTYVKSVTETHLEVGDPSNDEVRVNGNELRARVVGEGGNLGLTQLGRIEYSKAGGGINTDAVDNSGGVDLSDQEVNFKILLKEPVNRGDITLEERNQVLESFAEEFCQRVLYHNRSQNTAITIAKNLSSSRLDRFAGFLDYLQTERGLDREGEFLPGAEEIATYGSGVGLTRPEISVILAYSKMLTFESLLDSSDFENSFFNRFLYSYFPEEVVRRFVKDLDKHPLRKEIIATEIANCFTDLMGPVFLHQQLATRDKLPETTILSFLGAIELVDGRKLLSELHKLSSPESLPGQLKAISILKDSLTQGIRWFGQQGRIEGGLDVALQSAESLLKNLGDPGTFDFKKNHLTKEAWYKLEKKGLDESLRRSICWAVLKLNALEAAATARQSGGKLDLTIEVMKVLSERLGGNLFRDESSYKPFTSQPVLNARVSLAEDYGTLIEQLTTKLIESKKISSSSDCKQFIDEISGRLTSVDQALSSARENHLGTGELYICVKTLEEILASL